jgi:CDP-6-deoxy-D-xylo-4-hexulose-3-dehydrase
MIFKNNSKYNYSLLSNTLSKQDINAAKKVLDSGLITMSKKTFDFEKCFAKYLGVKFALMVNSGSSANLLAASLLVNPQRKKRLSAGDEVLIPVVCWSTSLWPLVQNNLKPIFVDIDLKNLNIDLEKLSQSITSKTKAIMLVHVLGLCADMDFIVNFAKKNNLIIIEDTCESLGSKFNNKLLGSFGTVGTFSFYYSHQITSGEGGMIVCNSKKDYEILYALRAHGWSRCPTNKKKIEKKYSHLDSRFIFINSGYNLRPTDIQSAIGLSQFRKKEIFKKNRHYNRELIIRNVMESNKFNNQIKFLEFENKIDPSWFGLAILINKKYVKKKFKYLKYLSAKGIETRPIISGNFINQPAIKLYKLNITNKKYHNAQIVENLGFFIGLHAKRISINLSKYIAFHLLMIDRL